jgi:dTDP-4-dehydrorhamnose 3,5-epimerase
MERVFKKGKIHDVKVGTIRKFVDDRGWLAELWRTDNVEASQRPVMTYISQTEPGVIRGPHEHVDQTDYFCFLGPGNFMLRVWDNRPDSATFNHVDTIFVGQDSPMTVIIPPGVVHAYKNVSHLCGIVINCPNALFRGVDYAEPIDEIRHEDDVDSPFTMHTH